MVFRPQGGARRATKILHARQKKAAGRMVKLKTLKRMEHKARMLYKTNIWPCTSFAVGSMGVAPSSIRKLRGGRQLQQDLDELGSASPLLLP